MIPKGKSAACVLGYSKQFKLLKTSIVHMLKTMGLERIEILLGGLLTEIGI